MLLRKKKYDEVVNPKDFMAFTVDKYRILYLQHNIALCLNTEYDLGRDSNSIGQKAVSYN